MGVLSSAMRTLLLINPAKCTTAELWNLWECGYDVCSELERRLLLALN